MKTERAFSAFHTEPKSEDWTGCQFGDYLPFVIVSSGVGSDLVSSIRCSSSKSSSSLQSLPQIAPPMPLKTRPSPNMTTPPQAWGRRCRGCCPILATKSIGTSTRIVTTNSSRSIVAKAISSLLCPQSRLSHHHRHQITIPWQHRTTPWLTHGYGLWWRVKVPP